MTFLNCKDCKDCSEREQNLKDKMDSLLGDLAEARKYGERLAIIEMRKFVIAFADCYLDNLEKKLKDK